MQSNYLQPPITERGASEAGPTDGPPIPLEKMPNTCDRCHLPSDVTHQVTAADGTVGERRCTMCVRRAEEDLRRAESARRRPEIDAELAKIRDRHEREAELPIDPMFCVRHPDTVYKAGRPAVGFNARGELCCVECLPAELNPAKLAERVAALEAALAAQQPAKSSRKAGA